MNMTLDAKLENILWGFSKKVIRTTVLMSEKGELSKKIEKSLDKAFERVIKDIKAVCKKEFAPDKK